MFHTERVDVHGPNWCPLIGLSIALTLFFLVCYSSPHPPTRVPSGGPVTSVCLLVELGYFHLSASLLATPFCPFCHPSASLFRYLIVFLSSLRCSAVGCRYSNPLVTAFFLPSCSVIGDIRQPFLVFIPRRYKKLATK